MQYVERAKAIRDRLRNPPNAVPDTGIDLKRRREDKPKTYPQELAPQKVPAAVSLAEPQPIEPIVVPDLSPKISHRLTLKGLIETVAEYYGMGGNDIRHRSRRCEYVKPRHIVFYLSLKYLRYSIIHLGALLDRDHTTIIHGRNKVVKMMRADPDYASEIKDIEDIIRAGFDIPDDLPMRKSASYVEGACPEQALAG